MPGLHHETSLVSHQLVSSAPGLVVCSRQDLGSTPEKLRETKEEEKDKNKNKNIPWYFLDSYSTVIIRLFKTEKKEELGKLGKRQCTELNEQMFLTV